MSPNGSLRTFMLCCHAVLTACGAESAPLTPLAPATAPPAERPRQAKAAPVSADELEIERMLSSEATVLDEQAIVTRLDSKVAGGGIDTTSVFERRLVPRIRECVEAVRSVSLRWAKAHDMQVVRDRYSHREHLQLLFRWSMESGLLEVLYDVDIKGGIARCRTAFYDLSGRRIEPQGADIPELSHALTEAITCALGGGSN